MIRYCLLGALLLTNAVCLAQTGKSTTVHNRFERGTLRDGAPAGIWQYVDDKGQPDLVFDYDAGQVRYARPDTALQLLRIGEEWQLAHPTRGPRLLGSHDRFLASTARSFRYPVVSLRMQQRGTVSVSFTVTRTGDVADVQVESSPSMELSREMLRVLGQQTEAWLPALYQGQPYDTRLRIVANFVMQGYWGQQAPGSGDLAIVGITTTTYRKEPAPGPAQPGVFAEFTLTNVR